MMTQNSTVISRKRSDRRIWSLAAGTCRSLATLGMTKRAALGTTTVATLGLMLAILVTPASAQLGSFNPNPGPQGTFAIRGGRVVTVSGAEIPNGVVVISGGKITAVGANVTVPSNAQVIDANGLFV